MYPDVAESADEASDARLAGQSATPGGTCTPVELKPTGSLPAFPIADGTQENEPGASAPASIAGGASTRQALISSGVAAGAATPA